MSVEYVNIKDNSENIDIDEFVNFHKRIDEIHKTISNNISIKFKFYNTINLSNISQIDNEIFSEMNQKVDSCKSIFTDKNSVNEIHIKNINFYIKTNDNINDNMDENINDNSNNYNCPICYNYIFKNISKVLSCNHSFCIDCFNNWKNACNEKSLLITCPMCRCIK